MTRTAPLLFVAAVGPVLIEATRRFPDALVRKGYDVEHVEVAEAAHNPEHRCAQLPAALAWTAGSRSG
jgi:hypothetical protein